MSAKHTATPWHVGGSDKCTIYDGFQQRIANSFEGVMATQKSDEDCKANAAFIVRACNAHDDLVMALQEMVNWYAKRGTDDLFLPLSQQGSEVAQAMTLLSKVAQT